MTATLLSLLYEASPSGAGGVSKYSSTTSEGVSAVHFGLVSLPSTLSYVYFEVLAFSGTPGFHISYRIHKSKRHGTVVLRSLFVVLLSLKDIFQSIIHFIGKWYIGRADTIVGINIMI